jgi:hypothetical protein
MKGLFWMRTWITLALPAIIGVIPAAFASEDEFTLKCAIHETIKDSDKKNLAGDVQWLVEIPRLSKDTQQTTEFEVNKAADSYELWQYIKAPAEYGPGDVLEKLRIDRMTGRLEGYRFFRNRSYAQDQFYSGTCEKTEVKF